MVERIGVQVHEAEHDDRGHGDHRGEAPVAHFSLPFVGGCWSPTSGSDRVPPDEARALTHPSPLRLADGWPLPKRLRASRIGPQDNISASGVIGLARDRVTIASSSCPRYFYKKDGGDMDMASAVLHRSLGRVQTLPSPAIQRAGYQCPQAVYNTPNEASPRCRSDSTWREATRFWPGGLVSPVGQDDRRQGSSSTAGQPWAFLRDAGRQSCTSCWCGALRDRRLKSRISNTKEQLSSASGIGNPRCNRHLRSAPPSAGAAARQSSVGCAELWGAIRVIGANLPSVFAAPALTSERLA